MNTDQQLLERDLGAVDAARLHREAVVIDGLVFTSDGNADILKAGGVTAVNVTVASLTGGLEDAVDQLAVWHSRLRQPGCGWHRVLTVDDILKAKEKGKVGLIMGWQNMTSIGSNPDRIALFHALGLRVMQPTYNEGNLIADGCLEPRNAGLTAFGRQVVREMNRVGVAIDLSHLSERSCLDIAEASEVPVLLTHANAKAVLDVPRNKSDEVIKAVAKTGGLIGVSVYGPMCWSGNPAQPPSLTDFARHLEHIVELVGIEHVSFGTDFPALTNLDQAGDIIAMSLNRYPGNVGRYAAAFGNDVRTRYLKDCGSPADLPLITDFLIKRGWSANHVGHLLGGNYLDVLRRIWKDRSVAP